MQAGFMRYGEERHPVPAGRPGAARAVDREARRGARHPAGRSRSTRSPLVAALRGRHAAAGRRGSRPSACRTGSARARTGACPRSSLTPILRFADVEAFVQVAPDGGRTAPSSTAFVQVGVAKEDQPHYLKVIARPEADVVRAHRLRARRHRRTHREGRRPSPGPRRHRTRANLRIADRPAPGGRRLRFDRQRHAADEGNPRPRRRTGPRAGRRPVSVGCMEDQRGTRGPPARIDRRPRRAARRRCRPRSSTPCTPCRTASRLIEVVHGPRPAAGGALPGLRGRRCSSARSPRPTSRSSSSTSARSATTTAPASSGRSTASAPSATATARSSG